MDDKKLQEILATHASGGNAENPLETAALGYKVFKEQHQGKREKETFASRLGSRRQEESEESPTGRIGEIADEFEGRTFNVSLTNAFTSIIRPMSDSIKEMKLSEQADTEERHIETTYLLSLLVRQTESEAVRRRKNTHFLLQDIGDILATNRKLNANYEATKGILTRVADAAVGSATFGFKLLFGARKKEQTVQEKILETNKKQLEFQMTGGIDQRRGILDLFKQGGLIGGLGQLARRGILSATGSGIDVAQVAEDKRAKGEELTFKEKRALESFSDELIKRGGVMGAIDYTRGDKGTREEPMPVNLMKIGGSLPLLENQTKFMGTLVRNTDGLFDLAEQTESNTKIAVKEQIKTRRTIWMGRIFGFFGSLITGVALVKTAIIGLGARILASKAVAGIAGLAGAGLAKLGPLAAKVPAAIGVISKGARFIPIIGTAITAGAAIFSGVGAYGRAAEIFGVESATTGQKISAAIGGGISALTLGLVNEKWAAETIYKFGNIVGDMTSVFTDTWKEARERGDGIVSAFAQSYRDFWLNIIDKATKPMQEALGVAKGWFLPKPQQIQASGAKPLMSESEANDSFASMRGDTIKGLLSELRNLDESSISDKETVRRSINMALDGMNVTREEREMFDNEGIRNRLDSLIAVINSKFEVSAGNVSSFDPNTMLTVTGR